MFNNQNGLIFTIEPIKDGDQCLQSIPLHHSWIASYVIKRKKNDVIAYETGPSKDIAKNRLLNLLTNLH